MEKIGRKPDLIRFSSQSRDRGEKGSLLRPRTVIYPLLLAGIATAFLTVFMLGKSFDAIVLREAGNPHTITDDNRVRNLLKFKMTNRTDEPMTFTAKVLSPGTAELVIREETMELGPREVQTFHVSVIAARDEFALGRANFSVKIENDNNVSRTIKSKLIGPYN